MRRSELKRGTKRLARGKKLARVTALAPGKGLARKPVKRKARKDTTPAKVRKLVTYRDGGQCARCPSVTGLHKHHRRLKGIGGDPRPHTECTCNIITLCSACHEWAHKDGRAGAEADGYIVEGAQLLPGSVSVLVGAGASSGMTAWLPCNSRSYSFKDPGQVAA